MREEGTVPRAEGQRFTLVGHMSSLLSLFCFKPTLTRGCLSLWLAYAINPRPGNAHLLAVWALRRASGLLINVT